MTWFKNYDFKTLECMYLNELKFYSKIIDIGDATKFDYCRYCYLSILLTQLRNGARLSEATDAIVNFYYNGNINQNVKVRKKKQTDYRLIIIPREIERSKLEYVDNLIDDYEIKHKKISAWVKKYFSRTKNMDLNTHTNRHACITYLALNNTNPLDIQGITKHSKLNMIMEYVHQTKGNEILKRLNKVDEDDRRY